MACKPVAEFKKGGFLFGVLTGVLVTLLLAWLTGRL